MKKSILFFVCILFTNILSAQESKMIKATEKYGNLAYVDAIETYLKVAKKGYKSKELFQKLGDSYYFSAKLKEANTWYTALFDLNESLEPEYYYRYAQTLKSVQDYKKAEEMLAKFYSLSSKDLRASIYNSQKDYKETIKKNSGRYEIKPVSINTQTYEYATSFYGDQIVFATSRDSVGIVKAKAKWTGLPFTNLHVATRLANGDLSQSKAFSSSLNSLFHEDTSVFTKDLKTVYFTRNNYIKRKIGRDDNKYTLLKLYKATLNSKGRWDNIEELPFNSDQYSVAHPALSPDEKTLYFASNMPGSFGQSDLYKVALLGDNNYGVPVNLGKTINTEGRETFPFLSEKNELIFATDGHPGLGGLDLFITKLDEEGMPTQIQNLGEPINSPMDDFGYIIDSNKKGFFSSNRDGGKGYDDVYSFIEKKPLQLEIMHELAGKVINTETGVSISGATVTLYDAFFNEVAKVIADDEGKYEFGQIPAGKKYYVRVDKEAFETKEQPVEIPNKQGKTTLEITTGQKIKTIQEGADLAKIFDIKIIYFDLDKTHIREDAAVELAKILEVMQQFPSIKVDVRSHTDCRQTAVYNAKLSDQRAKETIAWLIKNGINAKRLSGRGYGESQLVNNCGCEPTDASTCTEEEHQANRRSEFIIIKM